jgi:adenylate cyclase
MNRDTADPEFRQRVTARDALTFAAEERSGLMRAALVRSAAISAIILIAAAINAFTWPPSLLYNLGLEAAFLIFGLVQYALYRRGGTPTWLPFACVAIDCIGLTVALLHPNPFLPPYPPTIPYREAVFLYFFFFLLQSAFSFSPALVLWASACGALSWLGGFVWTAATQDVFVMTMPIIGDEFPAQYFDPRQLPLNTLVLELMIFVLVGIGLAALARRSRAVVSDRVIAERARANLARYFSPKIIDEIERHGPTMGAPRRQDIAVLFADIRGYTQLSEAHSPEDIMAMLRAFHARMEEVVFRHDGCLDKIIGDAVMATFGVPVPTPEAARNALTTGRAMLERLDAWNAERTERGFPIVDIGIGIHFGPAVLGDVGTTRNMAFAVIGDTVNVASRLQGLTRELGARIIASDAVIRAAQAGAGDDPAAGFAPAGEQTLRGRETPVSIWTFGRLPGPGGSAT